jgi:histidinol dehydrogenase
MALNIPRIDARTADIRSALDALREKLSPRGNVVSEAGKKKTIEVFGEALSPQQVVERIAEDVRSRGLAAVLEYSRKLDRAELTPQTLRVSADELKHAHAAADPKFLAAIRRIRDNIREFQQAILHKDQELCRPGVTLQQCYRPLERVGVCVPGGAAAYPSTVLMTAVPAQTAGVKEIAISAPPTAFGSNNPDVLATCHELGIREVYRLGGAHGVAALAYGIEGLPKVDKIVGPGNLFVTLAKKLVYGEVDIDALAGPSEVVVLADRSTRADYTAADMLAQAEHAPGSSILITWDAATIDRTAAELERQVAQLERCDVTVQSLEAFGCLILVADEEEACRVTNLIAPEHLHVAIDDARRLLPKLTTAGAVFLGNHSPVALGDYAAGPSHVLPTGGTGRWASGLSANSFLRSHSVIEYSADALAGIAGEIRCLAEKEGLTAHRESAEVRTRK